MNDMTTNTIAKVTLRAADASGVSVDDLVSLKKHRKISETRYIVYHYLHKELKMPTSIIGRYFNQTKRNVWRGIQLLGEWTALYSDVSKRYDTIIENIRGGC